jgi:hypothetical protein
MISQHNYEDAKVIMMHILLCEVNDVGDQVASIHSL